MNINKKIFKHIYTGNSKQAVDDIISKYRHQGYAIVHFLYFAQMHSNRIMDQGNTNVKYKRLYPNKKKLLLGNIDGTSILDYHKALLDSDFLLPDGIALQVLYAIFKLRRLFKSKKTFLSNLNGTDFVPYFLEEISHKFGHNKLNIILYGASDEVIELMNMRCQFHGYNVIYSTNGYSEFDWNILEQKLKKKKDHINIMLVARSTYEVPIQELWIYKNKQYIQKNGLLVYSVGGLFDFLVGKQKRAIWLIRVLKLEWLWRLISNPRSGYKKVLASLNILKYIFVKNR